MLSVMVPVTLNMSTKGYVAIHVQMTDIYTHRDEILKSVYVVFLVIFMLTLMILLVFSFIVYGPLKQITQGQMNMHPGI